MFASPTDVIAYGLRASNRLFRRYVVDLTPAEWDHQPCPGANTAAWVVGHLVLVDRRILGKLGAGDLPALPDGFEERFSATKVEAPPRTGLGDPKELLALFDAHRERLIEAVQTADPAKLAEAIPSASGLFTNVGEASLFMTAHTAMHAGQMTVVRRSLGKPPLF